MADEEDQMATKRALLNQLHSLEHTGFASRLASGAQGHSLPVPYLYAIASRETNCINELGDFRGGEFHGVGILQIDIQHSIARDARDSGSWKTDPQPLIEFGAGLLASDLEAVRREFPSFSEPQHLKIAASAYNCGLANAVLGAQHGDSDRLTTGHNYGRDVMTRMAIFEELLAEA
jgi:hypothetical protein